jgi:hypothetical protein
LLLMEATPDLCLMCHDADDSVLVSSHLGASLSSLDFPPRGIPELARLSQLPLTARRR